MADDAEPGGRNPLGMASMAVPNGQVYVIPERCKECGYCVRFCPEKVLDFSAEINGKGYHYPVMASGREQGCVDCGFCTLICPELAIYAEEVSPG